MLSDAQMRQIGGIKQELIDENATISIKFQPFRCEKCGSNVFTKYKVDSHILGKDAEVFSFPQNELHSHEQRGNRRRVGERVCRIFQSRERKSLPSGDDSKRQSSYGRGWVQRKKYFRSLHRELLPSSADQRLALSGLQKQ